MKEYKKLDLKNDNGATNLVHYLNEGWDIFREFPGWIIIFRDKKVVASTVDYEITQLALTLVDKENPPKTVREYGVLLEKATEIYMRGSVSPAEPRNPTNMPRKEWFETLKEPLRSQALEALEQFPDKYVYGLHFDEIEWDSTIQGGPYWDGAEDFFTWASPQDSDHDYLEGYEMARKCAPDGWEQQGAGE